MKDDVDVHLLTMILKNLKKLLKERMNEDDNVLKMRDTYVEVYNILVTMIANIDFKLYGQEVKQDKPLKAIFELIQDILYLFDQCPFDSHFNKLYLFE